MSAGRELVDIDFDNAEGFLGVKADVTEGQYLTYFLSHTMLFCAGALIEPGVVLTAASCVYGEKYAFEVFAGTHTFLENTGTKRKVQDICLHKKHNKTHSFCSGDQTCMCYHENLALLILDETLSFRHREPDTQFTISRLRYGYMDPAQRQQMVDQGVECHLYGWGSRRNGYLVPLLLDAMRVDLTLLNPSNCDKMWPYSDSRYLCVLQPPCRTKKYGALCPDDMGSVIACGGYALGIMTSRFVDRPCGVGFLDLNNFNKFLTCGVDDSRDVISFPSVLELQNRQMPYSPTTPSVQHVTRANRTRPTRRP